MTPINDEILSQEELNSFFGTEGTTSHPTQKNVLPENEIERLLSGIGSTPPPPPLSSPYDKSDKVFSQNELEALFCGIGNTPPNLPEPPNPSSDENQVVDVVSGFLTRDELDTLFGRKDDSTHKPNSNNNQTTEEHSMADELLSQGEVERLLDMLSSAKSTTQNNGLIYSRWSSSKN